MKFSGFHLPIGQPAVMLAGLLSMRLALSLESEAIPLRWDGSNRGSGRYR